MSHRVLILTTDSKICGTERIILSLLQNLDHSVFKTMLVTLKGPGDLVDEARQLNIEAINLQMDVNKIAGLKQWREVIKQFQPEILHSFLYHSNLLARITRIFTKAPVIAGLRTVYSKEAYGAWYGRLERWTHRWDKFYVVNSEQGLESARKVLKLSPQKLVLIRNGMPEFKTNSCVEIRQSVRREFGFTDEHLVIGVVAQLRPAKRHDLLLHSIARLKDQFPQIRLLIVGEGKIQPELEQLATQLEINQKVIFAGYRDNAQQFMLGFDIFALPSSIEGQPVSIMEAMQVGLPIVSTKVGGIPDLVIENETALLSEPDNLDDFTLKLSQVVQSKELRQEMGKKNQSRIESEFSAQIMAQKFVECYKACLK